MWLHLNTSLVSVVVPTYNSEQTIVKCIDSLINQTYKNIEIILVDGHSRDRTVTLVKSYDILIFALDAERTKAKNYGLSKSRGEYVLFIDSDMELNKRVIDDCVLLAADAPGLGGIIIPERSVGNSFWVKVRDFERSFYAETEMESARFFVKNLVDKAKGFDEGIVFFEESTLPQKIEKLGYYVKARISSEIYHHEADFSLVSWLKKKYYYGTTAWAYNQKFADYGKKQMSLLYRLNLFLLNKRFYSKPLLATGVIILKLLEYFSSGLGYIFSRANNTRL